MADLQRHSDDGWIKEGMILYYETPNSQTFKVIAGQRINQNLELPKQTEVTSGMGILIKVRVKSRCFYCKAFVVEEKKDTFTVNLPQTGWKSLPRRCFYRVKVSRQGRFNENTVSIKNISVAGASIETRDTNELQEGGYYKFQTGRFTTRAQVNEISDKMVRIQFPIKDSFNVDLNSIIRKPYGQIEKRETTIECCSVS